jgi:hypothetical protein
MLFSLLSRQNRRGAEARHCPGGTALIGLRVEYSTTRESPADQARTLIVLTVDRL